MAIRKPKGWERIQPSVGYGVDWSDPINKELKGCWLCNEGAGNAVYDATGFANKGTIGSSISWSTGLHGKALSYPGTNADTNAISVANSTYINIIGRVTMATWVYPTISNAYQCLFSKCVSGGTSRQYACFLSSGGVTKLFIALGGTDLGDKVLSKSWAVNAWNFFVVTADGTNVKIYLNGFLVFTLADAHLPGTNSVALQMGRELGSGFPLNGRMALSKVWNRDISSGEAFRLYSEPFAGILKPKLRLRNGAAASGGAVTGTIAATEAGDILAASGTVRVAGTIAVTEGSDVFAASGSVQTVGTIAATEGADVLAASGFLSYVGTIAATEGSDSLAATGKVFITGTAPLVESGDIFAASGTVSQPARTGTIAATESGDSIAMSGSNGALDRGGWGHLTKKQRARIKRAAVAQRKRDADAWDQTIREQAELRGQIVQSLRPEVLGIHIEDDEEEDIEMLLMAA